MPLGAPTTREIKVILPESSKVYAVDVVGNQRVVSMLQKEGIEVLYPYSIIERPLPEKVDIIRFTNVARYLSPADAEKAMINIDKSLKLGGYLLHEAHIFQKTPTGYKLIATKYWCNEPPPSLFR